MVVYRGYKHRFRKINVGDKVRVTKSMYGHNFVIGEIVEVLSSLNQESFYCRGDGRGTGYLYGWYLKYEEMEKV